MTLLGPQEREPIVYLRVSKESISTKRQSLSQSDPPFLFRCVRSTTVGRKGRSRLGHLHASQDNRTLLQWDGFRARHPSPRTGSVLGLASRYGVDLDEGPIDQTLFPIGRKPCHTRAGRRAWKPTKSTQLDATRQTTATCAIPRRVQTMEGVDGRTGRRTWHEGKGVCKSRRSGQSGHTHACNTADRI